MTDTIKITETFVSLQGESRFSGYPTFFIRTVGCNLRCDWCDTKYSYEGGRETSVNSIIEDVKESGVSYVCVTGGEPLLQKGCVGLLKALLKEGFQVSLETNGSCELADVPVDVVKVVDYKLHGSGEGGSFLAANLNFLTENDEVKFVVSNEEDFQEAHDLINNFFTGLKHPPHYLFSPVKDKITPKKLAELILESRLPHARLQVQLHKLLWNDERGK